MRSIWRRALRGLGCPSQNPQGFGRFCFCKEENRSPKIARTAILGLKLASSCPKMASLPFFPNGFLTETSQNPTGFDSCCPCTRSLRPETAYSGQRLASSYPKTHIHVNFLPRFAAQTSHFPTENASGILPSKCLPKKVSLFEQTLARFQSYKYCRLLAFTIS